MLTETARAVAHGPRRAALVVALLFVVSLPAVTTRIYASDEIQYFAFLRSLWFDRDVSFENEYQHFWDAGVAATPDFHETFLERQTETGRRINFGTIGCAILWAPFYAAGDLTARLLNAGGRDVALDGFSRPYVAAVCYGSALYGFLSLLLAVRVLDRAGIASRTIAGIPGGVVAAAVVLAGTPLVFYMYVAPPMAHATSAFTVSLLVLVWLTVRERWSARGALLLGAVTALAAMVREQDAFFAAVPAVDFAWTWIERARGGADAEGRTALPSSTRMAGSALAGLLAFAVAYLPQALAYLALNGRVGPSRLVARKMTWTAPHALQVLGSPEHGFLAWTPLAFVALAGLVVLAVSAGRSGARRPAAVDERHRRVRSRRLAVGFLVMAALQVYVAGSVETWTVAGAFGQRRFVALTVLLVAGLAVVAARASGRWRQALAVAVVLAVWWNLALAVQFGTGMMNRQRLELGRNAYHAFVTVPLEVPRLLYRYVFERQTFYRKAPGQP